MSGRRGNSKRDRSRSLSSDRENYERTSRNKNERPSRFSNISGGGNKNYRGKKVYVSNISFDATFIELKEEFSSVGEVTFVQMLKDENNRFKGCAVITFKESEMAQEAIETLNRREFKGRKLVVKEEEANPELKGSDRKRNRDDFDTRSVPHAPPSLASTVIDYNTYGLSAAFLSSLNIDLPLVNIVFVANLDYTVEANDLKEVFSLAGNVVECEIFKDKEGKSRGFGVVEYEHAVEAVQAISMLHNQPYRERLLTVRMDRSDRKKDSKSKLPPGLQSIGMGLGVDGNPLKDIKSLPAANPLASLNTLGQLNTVSVGGVSQSLTPQINPGLGLMDPLVSRMGMGVGGLAGGLATHNVGVTGRDYSQSQSQVPSYTSTSSSLGNIIQLSNLPIDYTNENLRKLCWNYGDIRVAEMRSQGTGMVKFRTEAEAQRAVNILDRQPLEGRILTARVL